MYEATIAGKKFYLQTIGERERAVNAIARLLSMGNPVKTQGAEGEEQTASEGEEPEKAGDESAPAEEEAEETEYWLLLCNKSASYPTSESLLLSIISIKKLLNAIISKTKKVITTKL